MPAINSLSALLLYEVKLLYDAEKQLVKALPLMGRAASDRRLMTGFDGLLQDTENHLIRLEQVFDRLLAPAEGRISHAMRGLIEEVLEAVGLDGPDRMRDVCLIGVARRVEYYEIAAYGVLLNFAEILGEIEVADLLLHTLYEEKKAAEHLKNLAATVSEEARLMASAEK